MWILTEAVWTLKTQKSKQISDPGIRERPPEANASEVALRSSSVQNPWRHALLWSLWIGVAAQYAQSHAGNLSWRHCDVKALKHYEFSLARPEQLAFIQANARPSVSA